EIDEPRNVRSFAIHPPASNAKIARIGKSEIHLVEFEKSDPAIFEEKDGRWSQAGKPKGEGKRPGLQGPIDDAFASPFLCVRGTGKPWNDGVQKWADANLKRFGEEWRGWVRGGLAR